MDDALDTAPARETALAHAARLLAWAEAEDNLPRAENLTECASGWISIAALQQEHTA